MQSFSQTNHRKTFIGTAAEKNLRLDTAYISLMQKKASEGWEKD